jgi:maltose-binding protein MalE
MFYETSALVYNQTYLEEWARQQALKELTNEEEDDGDEGDAVAVDEVLLAQKIQEYRPLAVPKTVADILTVADTFNLPEGVDSIMSWDVSDIFYNYWVVGQYMIVGGDFGDDITDISINNESTIQCLEVYKALNQFFSIESDTVTYDSVLQDFVEGKTVYTIVTTDAVKYLDAAKAEGLLTFEYGFSEMPEISAELSSRSMSVTNAVAVNGYSTRKELANRFASYLVDEYADKLYERTGKMSANLNTTADSLPLQVFMAEYGSSISLPKMMETGNFWLQLEVLFAKVWNGADVTASVQELEAQTNLQIGG